MSNQQQWLAVCDESDVLANIGVCAKVADKQIAIFKVPVNSENKLYAIDNLDPFSGSNVLSRGIVGDLKGREVVASPIYKQHFDLATGECLEEDITIPTYGIRVTNGKIEIAASNSQLKQLKK